MILRTEAASSIYPVLRYKDPAEDTKTAILMVAPFQRAWNTPHGLQLVDSNLSFSGPPRMANFTKRNHLVI
jgi:hypothetical protein